MELGTIISLLGILIVPALAYLLNKKDASQEKEIVSLRETCGLLFKKHDDDAAALASLRIEIAKEHYLKHELDARFHSLETAIKESSASLGAKFDKLADTLMVHLSQGNMR